MVNPTKRFKITLTTIDGEMLDIFEVALAGSTVAKHHNFDGETVGGFGTASLADRIKKEIVFAEAN